MAQQIKDHHYRSLSAHERFALLIEAMARRDEQEADRLEDTCPQFVYRAEDAAFRDRMRRAGMIASRVALNMRAGLAQIRLAKLFHENCEQFVGPSIRVAQMAFLYGRAYGKWEAGTVESIELPHASAIIDEVKANPDLARQLEELRGCAVAGVEKVAATLQYAVGELHAVDLLSQWEGFERFCRDTLKIEPLMLLHAFGLETQDPAGAMSAACPGADADCAAAQEWALRWTRSWERRLT